MEPAVSRGLVGSANNSLEPLGSPSDCLNSASGSLDPSVLLDVGMANSSLELIGFPRCLGSPSRSVEPLDGLGGNSLESAT